jgi:hypothetical protein
MTPALQDRPHTALDLLFGTGNDTPESLASQLLSADTGGDLGRALAGLPDVTREAAVREATAAAAGLLNVDLIGGLVAGWREHHDLTAAARRTIAAPGSVELVDMAGHQITMTQHPSVTVLVDGAQVATIQLGLSLVFRVNAMTARVSSGRLVALHSGRCDLTVTLAIQGTTVLTKQAHLTLPGAIPLGQGIRLLAAHHYPASAGQAESADNGPAPRMAPEREGTIQPPATPAARRGTGAPAPLNIGEWTRPAGQPPGAAPASSPSP